MKNNFSSREVSKNDWPSIRAKYTNQNFKFRHPESWEWFYQLFPEISNFAIAYASFNLANEVVGFIGGALHGAVYKNISIEALIIKDIFSISTPTYPITINSYPLSSTYEVFFEKLKYRNTLAIGFAPLKLEDHVNQLDNFHSFTSSCWFEIKLLGIIEVIGSSCTVKQTDFSENNWNTFWELRSKRIQFGIKRDQKFLHWRYHKKQGNIYWSFAVYSPITHIPIGFIVLSPRMNQTAIIVDCAFNEDLATIRDSLQKIQNWLYYKGIRRIETLSSPGCPEFEVWKVLGFKPYEPEINAKPFYKCFNTMIKDSFVNESFALTLGDSGYI
jgi:hypothetical protein